MSDANTTADSVSELFDALFTTTLVESFQTPDPKEKLTDTQKVLTKLICDAFSVSETGKITFTVNDHSLDEVSKAFTWMHKKWIEYVPLFFQTLYMHLADVLHQENLTNYIADVMPGWEIVGNYRHPQTTELALRSANHKCKMTIVHNTVNLTTTLSFENLEYVYRHVEREDDGFTFNWVLLVLLAARYRIA